MTPGNYRVHCFFFLRKVIPLTISRAEREKERVVESMCEEREKVSKIERKPGSKRPFLYAARPPAPEGSTGLLPWEEPSGIDSKLTTLSQESSRTIRKPDVYIYIYTQLITIVKLWFQCSNKNTLLVRGCNNMRNCRKGSQCEEG